MDEVDWTREVVAGDTVVVLVLGLDGTVRKRDWLAIASVVDMIAAAVSGT